MSLSTLTREPATREPMTSEPGTFEAPPKADETLPRAEERRDTLGRILADHAGDERTLVLSVAAPVAHPEVLLRNPEREKSFLWHPPEGRAFAGIGAVHSIDLDGVRDNGASRFEELRRRADEVWNRLVAMNVAGNASERPRLFGGFAFDAGAASRDPWRELGDGCFSLPRFLYARNGETATLSLAVTGGELATAAARDRWIDRLEATLSELEVDVVVPGELPGVESIRPSSAGWTEEIEAIRTAIASGEFEKIVAARRSRVCFTSPLDTVDVLLRLAQGLRASTRFAFCREHSTFLGATPERLVALSGLEVETEALAGSIATGQAERLLESGKDQREHQLVVDAIVRRLEPMCTRFQVAPVPRVRELREVLHLHTPIRGTLASPRHVLELVEKLHPTPAVGGVPTARAMRWIAEHEPDERGWYAAPVGWFDAAGDGEFNVALRSCVLRGREAYLYAGAGVVRDSNPDLEYHEVELKKQALLRALGASST